MLIKGTDVIGLKVISIQEGKEINKIEDLVYDPDSKRVMALITKSSGLFSAIKLLLTEDIKNVGKNAVIIDSGNVLKNISEVDQKISNIAKDNTYITKTKIVTEDGTELGYVSDMVFDTTSGMVKNFEVSQGLKDIQSGKKYINIEDIMTIGKDVIIVKSHTEEKIEKQAETGGLRGLVKEGTDKAKETLSRTSSLSGEVDEKMEEARPQVEEIKGDIQKKVEEFKDTAKSKIEEVQTTVEEKRKNNAIGRYLTINILNKSDEIIARRGDMITNHLIEEAEKNGVIDQVLNNTSEEPLFM